MRHPFCHYNWNTGEIVDLSAAEEREYHVIMYKLLFWNVRVFPAVEIPKRIDCKIYTLRECADIANGLIIDMGYVIPQPNLIEAPPDMEQPLNDSDAPVLDAVVRDEIYSDTDE